MPIDELDTETGMRENPELNITGVLRGVSGVRESARSTDLAESVIYTRVAI